MSNEAMAIALHHSRSSGTTKLVLLGIANHDGDGGAWPSLATLATYAGGVSERTVSRAIGELVELGEVLKKAAEKGTIIHEQVELFASLGIEPASESVKDFVAYIKKNGYEIIGSEYVLRIGEDHASAIDLVMHKDDAPDEDEEEEVVKPKKGAKPVAKKKPASIDDESEEDWG
jgi:DNA-binding transcriptional regulator YhcF (GntR family)